LRTSSVHNTIALRLEANAKSSKQEPTIALIVSHWFSTLKRSPLYGYARRY
jgi:hypothetical protein